MQLLQVDAFSDRPFAGNPAAVCLAEGELPQEWMQNLAREMNLSETAFPLQREDGSFDLRWFTPAVEVELCGHATLATAHALWQTGRAAQDQPIVFHTRSGELRAFRQPDGWITLDFPARPVQESDVPAGLLQALGLETVRFCGRFQQDVVLEVGSETVLRQVQPNFAALLALPVRDVILTCRAETPPYDFVSRVFAPAEGIPEDPVTGSAHCLLAPYWGMKLNRSDLLAYQASARGGVLRLRWQAQRVFISGQAVTVFRADLGV
ncbi:MAG: PhzF family phenazine biosynthesis protein [Longilinea sp.]|nr:PhzF family phenazine biosynthesis protein [Longilinea sp.]